AMKLHKLFQLAYDVHTWRMILRLIIILKGDMCTSVIPHHEKTPYHIINDRKPSVKFFYIFGCLCSIVRDGEKLDKMKEKDHVSSDPVPECQRMVLEHDSLSPAIQRQENFLQADRTVSTSNKLDLLFSLMFDELLNGSSKVVSKSSAVFAADAPNQRQHHTTPLNNHTTPASTCQVPTLAPTITSYENINQAEMYAENDQVTDDEFINIFYTLIQDQGETSLQQVIRNPSQSVRTIRQLESDVEMWMFALTVSRTEPKNIKEAMADSAWIESMQEELHQFDRLDEKVYVNQPDGFVDPYHPDKVYRLKKALYGLKQAPRAWCDELSKFLLSKGFSKASGPDIMHETCYCARYQVQPTEKHLTAVKQIFRYLKYTIHMGLWYPKDTVFDVTAFSDSDHAGCLDSRKSTSGVLWMRTQLIDYGFHFDKIPMYCDSKAAIAISCNPVQHSHTKHIDVRYHFIKEKVKKGIVELFFVGTEYQLADLFTKALPEERFKYLIRQLGMRCLTQAELEALANEFA
nr:hypothetical protein [Tanacetum cinerariifolium]